MRKQNSLPIIKILNTIASLFKSTKDFMLLHTTLFQGQAGAPKMFLGPSPKFRGTGRLGPY